MNLRLERSPSVDGCTLGRLFVDGAFECFALEDVVRHGPKVLHETAISAGRYRVVISRSRRFNRMLPELLGVPEFTGVRIHGGNTAADTSGCILVGQGRIVDRLVHSQAALEALLRKIAAAQARGEEVWIEIRNASGALLA